MKKLLALALLAAALPVRAQVKTGVVVEAGLGAMAVSPLPGFTAPALQLSPLSDASLLPALAAPLALAPAPAPHVVVAPVAAKPFAPVAAAPLSPAAAAPAALTAALKPAASTPEKPGSSEQARTAAGALFDGAARLSAASIGDEAVVFAPAPEERRSSGLSPPTEQQIEDAFKAANPDSSVPVHARRVSPSLAGFASEAVKLWTFVASPGVAMSMMIRRGNILGVTSAVYTAGRELLAWAGGPAGVGFQEMLGRWRAREENANLPWAPARGQGLLHLPENPLGGGEYWDMASGMLAAAMIRRELEPRTNYTFFDMSPFVSSYLRETADIRGAGNVRVMQGDILAIREPEKPLAVLRTKNAVGYVPDFAGKLETMADWIAPGGRLIMQNDPERGQRENSIYSHASLLQRLMTEGWAVEYTFADFPPLRYTLDTLILTRPKGKAVPRLPHEVSALWHGYLRDGALVDGVRGEGD